MGSLITTLILALAFLSLVVLVLRTAKKYSDYNLHNWKLILGGVGLLFWGGNLNRLFTWNLSQASSPVWLRILNGTEIFSYVVGGSLMVIGFLQWYKEAAEAKKNSTRRLRQLTCLHSLLSTINRHQDLDEILKGALADIINILGYKSGVIFKPTFDSPEMKIVAHEGIAPEKLYMVFDLYTKNVWYRESSQTRHVTSTAEIETLPEYGTLFSDEDGINSFACVPIKFSGKILGLLGLYDSNPDRFSYQETQFLTCLGETLGLSIQQNLASHRNKKRRNYLSALANISDVAQEGTKLQELFPRMAAEIKRIIDFDQMALFLNIAAGRDPEVVTIGKSGGVLVERHRGGLKADGVLEKVINSQKAWVDHSINVNDDQMDMTLAKNCGIKSQIVFPLVHGESTYGVVSLGHQQVGFYSTGEEKWLRPLILLLSRLVFEQAQNERLIHRELLNNSLSDFEKRLASEENVYTLIKDVTSNLASELPKSFVRLCLLNQQKDQLISCATHQIRSEGIDLRKDAQFPLKELPWHRMVLTAKKPMLINQDDPESYMSKDEADLIMDRRIKSGVLIPLLMRDVAVGVISIGEMRSWTREPLIPAEIGYMKHRANQVCIALKKGLLSRSNTCLREELKKREIPEQITLSQTVDQNPFFNLSYKINNALTAIRGSAELLRYSRSNVNPDSLKYLKTIENGVDRIHSCLEEFSYSPYVHKGENREIPVHEEQVSS
jgi:transcriptional regulator with GAF, ATPase, and Fis domain